MNLAARVVAFVLFLASALPAQTASQTAVPTTAPARSAAVIEIDGTITDVTYSFLKQRYAAAEQAGANVVILDIDTWGGGVAPALEISRLIKDSKLETIAFVDRKAVSAGALIAIACDRIVMKPGAMIGDCAPIIPGQSLEPTERAKSEGPILADFYDSAVQNHHDITLVQSMVTLDRVVHYVEHNGTRRFVDGPTYEQLVKEGWTPVEGVPNPIDNAGSLLTINGDLAARLGLATLGTDVDALARDANLNVVATYGSTFGQELISLLSNDVLRGLLTMIFLATLYMSLSHPGTGAPEVACVICLSLLLGVPMMTGWASWIEVMLILLGVALLALEIFVIPGFGVAGITGLVLVFAGLVLSFVPAEPTGPGWLPTLPGTWAALKTGLLVTLFTTIASMGLWVAFNRFLPRLPVFNRLVLQTNVGTTPDPRVDATRETLDAAWPAIGAAGVAHTDLRPGGTALFRDELINDTRLTDVVSDYGFVRAGTELVVREKEGTRVVVRPANQASGSQNPAREVML